MSVKRAMKNAFKDVVLDMFLPRVYRKAAKNPINPRKVVFVEVRERSLSESFALLHARLSADGIHDVSVSYLHESSVGLVRYARNCVDMLREIATASVVFLNDASNVVSCVPLRDETKVVQIWHACGAFKKFGMSTAEKKFGGTRADKERHPFYKNLSLVTVSSPEVVWAYVEAMALEDCPDIVQPLGIPRTDVFFDEVFLRESRSKIEHIHSAAVGKKIALYAPTFRGKVAEAQGPDALDFEKMRPALGNEWVFVIRHHPFVKNLPVIPDSCREFAFYASEDESISELMAAADLCVSDYSSLVFEYSLLGRPMVFFAYDRAEYDDWRGFYYDYDAFTPGPVVKTTDELIDYIAHVGERFDAGQVAAFRKRFMSACDGRATERLCEAVFR